MTNSPTKTYIVGVIERAVAYYEVDAEDAGTAAENWQDGKYHDRDDEALETEGPCNVHERLPDGKWRKIPRVEWDSADPEPESQDNHTPAAGLPTRFDAYEIAPCSRFREDGERDRFYYEPCEPDEADVWTLYGHVPGLGVEAIGDFETRELAEEVFARITGRRYANLESSTL